MDRMNKILLYPEYPVHPCLTACPLILSILNEMWISQEFRKLPPLE